MSTSAACCGLAKPLAPVVGEFLTGDCCETERSEANKNAHPTALTIQTTLQRSPLAGVEFILCSCDLRSVTSVSYLRRPPPPRLKPPPPPRDAMLEVPRLLPARAFDPLYPREPPPNAFRFPPPLRERSRLPMRSAPPAPAALLPKPALPARLLMPPPPARLLGKFPPCRPTCCRALAWRLESESPRVVPPNLSAVARSPYGAPPRCAGLCCHRSLPPRSPRIG